MGLKYICLLVVAILVTAAVACGNNAADGLTTGTAPITGEVQVIEVSIGGPGPPRFRPNLIDVQRGTAASFRVTGSDNLNHTFTVSTLNMDLRLDPGETIDTPPVMFNQVTTIFFICRLHTASGATGTIRVTN